MQGYIWKDSFELLELSLVCATVGGSCHSSTDCRRASRNDNKCPEGDKDVGAATPCFSDKLCHFAPQVALKAKCTCEQGCV